MEARKLLLAALALYLLILLAVGGWLLSGRQEREAQAQAQVLTRTALARARRLDPSATVTPSNTPTATDRPVFPTFTPSLTPSPTLSPTLSLTNTLGLTLTLTARPSPTITPTPSRTPRPTQPRSTATPTISPTAPDEVAALEGRILINGTPAGAGVTLIVEIVEPSGDRPLAETVTTEGGAYQVSDLPISNLGYNLVFGQEENEQLSTEDVLTWAWFERIPVSAGETVDLPDLDIAPRGFRQLDPAPGATLSAAGISPAQPLTFTWAPHPETSTYWVNLFRQVGEEQQAVWETRLVTTTSADFDGELEDGTSISPGDYWWGVGGQGNLGGYTLNVYGLLAALTVEP